MIPNAHRLPRILSVCKYYLCDFCPAELFTNTRSDLGPCEKIHDENLRKMYEKSSRFMKEGYERDFLRYLQSLLAEVERRIRRGHARLALSQAQQNSGAPGPSGKNEEKSQVLTTKIEELVLQIEELGSEGRVEEAQGMMKLVEQLKEEREQLNSTPSTIESFAAQEKQMEVCEVCGAFLIVGDAQSRVDDHLMGKQHMGYAKIKATVEELKVRRKRERKSEKRRRRESGRRRGNVSGRGRGNGTGAGGVTPTADTPAARQTAAGAAQETGRGPGVRNVTGSAAGAQLSQLLDTRAENVQSNIYFVFKIYLFDMLL
uniref:LUC7-like 3 pre-mRNA splicing factor n=1 Tax=Sinocyclocheilus grahami TaxID=75366 RepID=A0A672P358_SINGR